MKEWFRKALLLKHGVFMVAYIVVFTLLLLPAQAFLFDASTRSGVHLQSCIGCWDLPAMVELSDVISSPQIQMAKTASAKAYGRRYSVSRSCSDACQRRTWRENCPAMVAASSQAANPRSERSLPTSWPALLGFHSCRESAKSLLAIADLGGWASPQERKSP